MVNAVRQPCDEAVVLSQSEVRGRAPATGRWVLAAAILGSSIAFIDGTVVNVALPVLQRELGASVAEAQWIVESYALMLAALILAGGSLGDRLGRRRVFVVGVTVFALASVWCGLAPNISQLVVARAFRASGRRCSFPGAWRSSAPTSPRAARAGDRNLVGLHGDRRRSRPGARRMAHREFSWRWIFFINVPLAAAVLLITWRHVPESRDKRGAGKLDWPGAALATWGSAARLRTDRVEHALLSAPAVIAACASASPRSPIRVLEGRAKYPMMPLALFRSRSSPAPTC